MSAANTSRPAPPKKAKIDYGLSLPPQPTPQPPPPATYNQYLDIPIDPILQGQGGPLPQSQPPLPPATVPNPTSTAKPVPASSNTNTQPTPVTYSQPPIPPAALPPAAQYHVPPHHQYYAPPQQHHYPHPPPAAAAPPNAYHPGQHHHYMPQHHPPPAQVPRPQQQQQPQQQHPQQQQTQHHPPPQQAVQQTPAPPQSQLDTADVATLRDALGSAGIDIRAEEEAIHRGQDMGQSQYMGAREDRSHKQTVIDSRLMGQVVRGIATKHNVTKVSEDSVNYLALALRARLQSIIGSALSATSHRTASQFSRPPGLYPDGSPMWTEVVRRDVGKQLTVLEKVEREDEQRARRERREKMEAGDSAGVSGVNGGPEVGGIAGDAGALGVDEDGKKRKKKTDGPGVTARNMSEDVRKKMSDAVATRAAGLGANKYAWMTAGASASPAAKKPNPPAAAAGSSAPSTTPTPLPRAAAPPPAGSGWARAYVAPKQATAEDDSKTVTLRDLMFVVQRERGHGGGRGSAKGWT